MGVTPWGGGPYGVIMVIMVIRVISPDIGILALWSMGRSIMGK